MDQNQDRAFLRQFSGVIVGFMLLTVALIFLARFIEIAPALLAVEPGAGMGGMVLPIVSAALVLAGFLGGGLLLFGRWLLEVPLMALNDVVFATEFDESGGRE